MLWCWLLFVGGGLGCQVVAVDPAALAASHGELRLALPAEFEAANVMVEVVGDSVRCQEVRMCLCALRMDMLHPDLVLPPPPSPPPPHTHLCPRW